MAYKKKKPKLPPGTWLERDLFQSKAFLSLRGFAPQLLILLLGKRQREYRQDRKGVKEFTWVNLNNITLTYKELFEKHGVTIPRATRAFNGLLAKGFIEIKHLGGAYQQDKNVYALTTEWASWIPGTVVRYRDPDVKRGFQGKKKEPAGVNLFVVK